jgi:hypothetical protein
MMIQHVSLPRASANLQVRYRPEPAPGISAEIARKLIRDWTNGKHEKPWQAIHGERQAFLKDPLLKKAGELLNLSRHQLRIIIWLLTGHCHLKGHPFKLGLVDSSECVRCKQA